MEKSQIKVDDMLEIIKYQADLKCQTHLKYMLIFILYMYFSTASIYLEHRENLYYTLITKTKEKKWNWTGNAGIFISNSGL